MGTSDGLCIVGFLFYIGYNWDDLGVFTQGQYRRMRGFSVFAYCNCI